MIVMKFGGTSVEDPRAIRSVVETVLGHREQKPVVVVSAMAKITDSLLAVVRQSSERHLDDALTTIEKMRTRHHEAARELVAPDRLNSVLAKIDDRLLGIENLARSIAVLGESTPRSQDAIVSQGEMLSSLLVTEAMIAQGAPGVLADSREFIITDAQFTRAVPQMTPIIERAASVLGTYLSKGQIPVTQGFIGSTSNGITTTLGRGGSDYSAALIGAALKAEEIQIWTDVDGMMTTDPRVVPEARRIEAVSFDEAAELAYFGAKVLHPSTVLPAIEREIPVRILNTKRPSVAGTLITAEPRPSKTPIKSIAFRRNVIVLNVSSARMLEAHGFLRAIFEIFDRYRTSVDVVSTSEVSVSMTIESTDKLNEITHELSQLGRVTVEQDKAIICVVGDNLKSTSGIAGRLFGCLDNINISMISQGASKINLTFVCDNANVEKAVRQLHTHFFPND
jgi:aspartate kinase